MGPLAKQAETAKEYLRLREELKCFDVNLFLADLKAIEDQKLELAQKEHMVNGDMEESKAAAEALKEEYDRISEAVRVLDEKISEKQNAEIEAKTVRRELGRPDQCLKGADPCRGVERGAHQKQDCCHRRGIIRAK